MHKHDPNHKPSDKPKLFYCKIIKHYEHQGAQKKAMRIITTHNTSIMPKYFRDRGWSWAKAEK